ncbi:hypothetical protein KQI76_06755 [Amphibacillus sp. MSJ-3]|uniref:hypothetical protein n=1 Tax=Amphibacillus sp. MSJ-3 TaxID=2841505 RepID=UPI001C0EC57D|nr:hypothetical protein [Amphibacillus sp. MSJ-3]MBU5594861.1 hypothetical protein [Amphibacillus sp. MSJ-3]
MILNQLLNDPNVMSVNAIDTRDSLESELFVDEGLIQPMRLLPYIKNVKHVGDYVQNVTLATVWTDPGIKASLTNSWSRTATFSSNTGITRNKVNLGLNFTVGKSYTISYTGSYTAPKTYNGKKVKQVKLYAKPIREKNTFDVYEPTKFSWNLFADPYQKNGTGTAYKPVGVSYTKTFVYK